MPKGQPAMWSPLSRCSTKQEWLLLQKTLFCYDFVWLHTLFSLCGKNKCLHKKKEYANSLRGQRMMEQQCLKRYSRDKEQRVLELSWPSWSKMVLIWFCSSEKLLVLNFAINYFCNETGKGNTLKSFSSGRRIVCNLFSPRFRQCHVFLIP